MNHVRRSLRRRVAAELNVWYLWWRIVRGTSPALFRLITRPVTVSERRVTCADAAIPVREYRPDVFHAMILLNGGFVQESMDDPRLRGFAKALAELGFLVVTPDYPAVRALAFDPRTIDQVRGMMDAMRREPSSGGLCPLVVIALSYMGTITLKAALSPNLVQPPEMMVVLGGYADFGDLMHDVFRDVYRGDGSEVPVDPYGRYLVVRSALSYFNPPPDEHAQIADIILALGRRIDPSLVDERIALLTPSARECVSRLREFTPTDSPEVWQRILAGAANLIEALSVTESPDQLRSRLVVLHSMYDHILPYWGSVELHRRFPSSELVLTTLLTHVNPRISIRAIRSQLTELRTLFRVLRELVALAS